MQEAATKSLTVAKSVDRLKRLHWSLKRLYQIFIAHIPSIPIYELKMAFIAHGEIFAEIRPAATMIEVKAFIAPEMMVEIEADAIIAAELK